jgi:hypothetical protein
MSTNIDINVHHVTRIEGHGNIVVNVEAVAMTTSKPSYLASAGSARSAIRWSPPKPSKMRSAWK